METSEANSKIEIAEGDIIREPLVFARPHLLDRKSPQSIRDYSEENVESCARLICPTVSHTKIEKAKDTRL